MSNCVDCSLPECPICLNCHTMHCDSSVMCKSRKYIKGYKVLMADKKIIDVEIGDIKIVKSDEDDFEERQKRWEQELRD